MDMIRNESGEEGRSLDSLGSTVLALAAFLLPLFFIPAAAAPFLLTKTALILLSVIGAFLLFIVSRLKEGGIRFPLHPLFLSVWLLPLVYFVSSLFTSSVTDLSFAGARFDTDTFAFILAAAFLLSLPPLLITSRGQLLRIFAAFLLAAVPLAVFQFLRLVGGPSFLSFGIFTDSTSNLLGRWNDLGIFFGAIAILSLVSLELLSLSRLFSLSLGALLVVSLFFLGVVNFSPVWYVVGVFALGFFIYSLLRGSLIKRSGAVVEEEGVSAAPRRFVSLASLLVLGVSIVFIVGGVGLRDSLSNFFAISQLEARPSLQTTFNIAKETYKDNALLGSGPNTFGEQWALFKPREVNDTVFWNVNFTSGFGFVPTSFVTVGILGILAWLFFFGLYLLSGIRSLLFNPSGDSVSYYLSLSSFLVSLFLWVFAVVYVPGPVILALAFLFTGLFLASLRLREGGFPELGVSFADNPRLGFVSVLVLTVFLLLSIVALYIVGVRLSAGYFFQRSLVEFNIDGNRSEALASIDRAARLYPADNHYQLAANIHLFELNDILNRTDIPQSERRTRFQTTLTAAISAAQAATVSNPNNYQNWLLLGQVYQTVVPLGIEGAEENTRRSYERALLRYPLSPEVPLLLAELNLALGRNSDAKDEIRRALLQKQNYTDAAFLLSQIQVQEGQITDAISSAEAAALFSPNNPALYFQLGLLHYSVENNDQAIGVFEQAVSLNSDYANARYFLGLTYARVGRTEEAIEQFERVAALNPGNDEVLQILENLKLGEDPFADAQRGGRIQNLQGPPIKGE